MPISLSGSLIITGSITAGSITGSLSGSLIGSANSASFAQTASSADNFVVRQGLTGSNALFTGAITAQTLVVQTVTSSIVYSSGSNRFGNQLTDVQQMTGSLRVTGSGDHYIVGGNVGVGTTSPASKTHISFQNDFDGLRIQNSNRGHNYLLTTAGTSAEYFSIYDLDNSQYLYQASNAGHSFLTGGSTRIAITSGGDVGIGTTNPGSKLHVSGGFIRVEGTSTDQYFLEGVRTGASTTLRIYDNNSVVYYDSYNSMAFRANQNGGNSGVIVFNGGNVLINTTTDSGYKLDVNGTGRFTGDVTTDSTYNITTGLKLWGNHITTEWYNGNDTVFVNYRGYNSGLTQFRNFHIYDGKQNIVSKFDGDTKDFIHYGNLGIGVTPSAWSTGKAFEINSSGNGLWSYGQENIYLLSNAYYNGGFKYGGNGKAGDYEIFQGAHYWNIAPNNTSGAGAALTFTQAMTLSSDGNLRIGTTSDYLTNGASRRNISINGTSETILTLGVGDTWKSYFFTNATGTQLVASGSNTVYIGNTPGYLYINSSGNFGIGTTSPSGRIHVTSLGITASQPQYGWPVYNAELDPSSSKAIYVDTGGNGPSNTAGSGATVSLILGQYYDSRAVITTIGAGGDSPSDQGTGYGKDLMIKAGTSDNGAGKKGGKLYLNGGMGYQSAYNTNVGDIVMQGIGGGGNVGIGTTSPSQKLHIYNGNLLVNNNASGDTNSGIRIVAPISTTHVNWMLAAQQNVSNTFEITPSTTVGGTTFSTPTAVFTNDGKVGIGTTSPSYALDVVTTGQSVIQIKAGTTTDDSILVFGDSAANAVGRIYYSHAIDGMLFYTNSTEKVRITSGGNVGIGTTTPAATLDVNGNANISGSITTNGFTLKGDPADPNYNTRTRIIQDTFTISNAAAVNFDIDTLVSNALFTIEVSAMSYTGGTSYWEHGIGRGYLFPSGFGISYTSLSNSGLSVALSYQNNSTVRVALTDTVSGTSKSAVIRIMVTAGYI